MTKPACLSSAATVIASSASAGWPWEAGEGRWRVGPKPTPTWGKRAERAFCCRARAWASCSVSNPFPGSPGPTQICLQTGFDPELLYQVVFTAQDPPVLGIGYAAFRDVVSFFRNATVSRCALRVANLDSSLEHSRCRSSQRETKV